MSAVISLSEVRAAREVPRLATVRGTGRVAFSGADGTSRLRDLYQHDPVRVMMPMPARGDIPCAAFVTTSGGLVGGDELDLAAAATDGAGLQVTAQAAEKVYRSTGADCRVGVALEVAGGSWLEWLPQETIVFEGARLNRRTNATVSSGGRLLAGEILVLGRTAMGETVTSGRVLDAWEIHRDGRLIWADCLHLEDDIAAVTAHPAGLDGARALATAVYAADDAPDHLETARALLGAADPAVRAGATLVNGVLLARFLSADGLALRNAFGQFWAGMRNAAAGLPDRLPRLWHI